MVNEEEKIGDAKLCVAHEYLKVVVHCIVAVLHAEFEVTT